MDRSFKVADDLVLTMTETGTGRPALVLHGGGGPFTVAPISVHLAKDMRAITPTHPGWNGSARPDRFCRVADIADAYLAFLKAEKLRDVLVVGSSMGGWIAAEMAIRDTSGTVGAMVLINAVGIEVPEQPILNIFGLSPREITESSFFDPDRFYIDPASLPPERVVLQRANMQALKAFAGDPYMHDAGLLDRLAIVTIPALVIWGESDRIVTPTYGMAYARALQNAEFALLPFAGHLPQIEQPEATFALVDAFRLTANMASN